MGERVVPSSLCQNSSIGVRRVQRSVSSCWAVAAPFLPYVPECVGGRLAEGFSLFLSLGPSRARSLMLWGCEIRSWGCARSRPGP